MGQSYSATNSRNHFAPGHKPPEETIPLMDANEAVVEQMIQNKGLTAPRLTPQQIDAAIKRIQYCVFPDSTLTVCAITLQNGFIVTGESAAASPENFNEEIGKKVAFDNARQKIWAFEGYLLRERLHHGAI